MTDRIKFFGQPINSMNKTYKHIRKISAGQGDEYYSWLFVRLFLF